MHNYLHFSVNFMMFTSNGAFSYQLSILCIFHSIFFEPLTFDITTTGFDHVPGGQAYSNRSVLSYHFYVPPQVSFT